MVEPAPARQRDWASAAGVVGLMVVAFGLRLAIGTIVPLDGDEAVEGIAALRILHGHFVLMESNARYLGALDSYILAPFIAVFGPTQLAIRIGLSLVGAFYVAASFVLGRFLFGKDRAGLLVAAIAAVFPLFALTYGIKARTYGVLLLLEVVCLILGLRLAWARRPPPLREWAAFGLIAGLSMWHDVLLGIPIVACLAAFLWRGSVIEWARLLRGASVALLAGLVGFSPWLLYNAQTRLGSLRHLYTPLSSYSIPTGRAVREALDAALPIFVGDRVNFCGPRVVPSVVIDIGLGLLAVAVLWLRRDAVRAIVRGRFSQLEPVDAVLLVPPLSLLAVTVHWFNALSCEPRYLMPLAVPLVVAMALVIRGPHPFRAAGLITLAVVVVISTVTLTTTAQLYRDVVIVPGVVNTRLDLSAAAAALEREHPQAVWAHYWLARPVEYLSGDRLVVGEYGGYVGFPDVQRAALAAQHPGWLFVATDPEVAAFKAACASRGISYRQTTPVAGLVFFADLSVPLLPSDLGIQTQSVSQAA